MITMWFGLILDSMNRFFSFYLYLFTFFWDRQLQEVHFVLLKENEE